MSRWDWDHFKDLLLLAVAAMLGLPLIGAGLALGMIAFMWIFSLFIPAGGQ
ncbi:hypothetical protein [Deinococcus cellulosilyticus]|uniref:Uncharacterized protein n=1 Tax=Deinococcus cellulosilyticus (strain DSM 18568 / NBRC 106333 / KACC 11606 / 5516J-15) TaxID=1223518 RepID=A0A511MY96_DEIC1|nr:hypothetical protein [Deinococcus cellulosilyticus]GEM45321.1 hypothetical protein DC3_09560 [Deinococcus cellulosilyticus NBRC 106333 = KACC 11606]